MHIESATFSLNRHFDADVFLDFREDAATGSAACTLASYLSLTEGNVGSATRYEICQGVEMGRKSDIFVHVKLAEGKRIDTIHLSGSAVQTMEGTFFVQ